MKQIWVGFLCWMSCLSAVNIPVEENLSVSSLDNGIEVWLKPCAVPARTISCRVIAKHPFEAAPQIFPLNDCTLDEFEEELPFFVEDCKESIPHEEACKIVIIAVGDFVEPSLRESLSSAFEVFSQRTPPISEKISIQHAASGDVYVSLSYQTSFQDIKTDQDVKRLWMLYLLQSVVEERFRKIVKDVNGQWIPLPPTKYLLPYDNTMAKGKQMLSGEPDSMLLAFLLAMQDIKTNGFSDQELSEAKAKLQKNLLNFYQKNPTSRALADYLASHAACGAGHPDYSIFMTLSLQAISEIEKSEVLELIRTYFKDDTRRVQMTVPEGITIAQASIEQALDRVKTDDLILNFNSHTSDTDTVQVQSYQQLVMTENEAKIIYQIIDSLGNWGLGKLFWNQSEMEALGNKVQHVHPLKFLEKVLLNPHLKQAMIKAKGTIAKWRGFLHGSSGSPGFLAKCNREADRNNFAPYIVGFCQVVEAHPEQVRYFVERREWEKLVLFLFNLEN